MKPAYLLLLCGAFLAACANPGGSSSSDLLPADSSQSANPEADFLSRLSALKATSSYAAAGSFTIVGESGGEETTSYGTQLQFGPDALLWVDEEGAYPPSGALKNGNQGVFTYTLGEQGQVQARRLRHLRRRLAS